MYLRFWFFALAMILMLTACTSTTPMPAPTPTNTDVPPIELSPPTSVPTSTKEPTITPTSVPSATLTLTPTGTPAPSETTTPTETPTLLPTRSISFPAVPYVTDPIYAYYIQSPTGAADGCQPAFGLSIGISRSNDVAKDVKLALQSLFAVKTEFYGSFYNPLFRSNIKVQSVKFNSKTGLITVDLSGTYVPSGEDCDNTGVKNQVWGTVRQYRAVKMTNIYLNGIPFGDRVSNDK